MEQTGLSNVDASRRCDGLLRERIVIVQQVAPSSAIDGASQPATVP